MVSFSRCHHHLPLIQLVVVSSRPTFCLLSRSIPTAMNMKAQRLAIRLPPLATLDLNTIVRMPIIPTIFIFAPALSSSISLLEAPSFLSLSSSPSSPSQAFTLSPRHSHVNMIVVLSLCPSVDLLPVISVVAVVIIIFITIILIDDCSRVPLPLP